MNMFSVIKSYDGSLILKDRNNNVYSSKVSSELFNASEYEKDG